MSGVLHLVVLHKQGDALGVYDVDTGERLHEVPTRPFPHEIAASPDGRTLYVAEYGLRGVEAPGEGGDSIGVYDAQTFVRTNTFHTGGHRRPHGIVAHPSGRLFVTCEPTRRLLVLDAATGALVHDVDVGQDLPHLVAVSPDGARAFTANIGSGSLTAIDVASGRVVATMTVLDRPEGMVFSEDGRRLYVVNRGSNAIAVIDPQAARMVGRIATAGGPVRVARTPDGERLIVPLFHDHAVQIVDLQEGRVTATVPVGKRPAGIALSPAGRLAFASCEDDDTVYVIALATAEVVERIPTGRGPDAMVCLRASGSDAAVTA